MRFAGDKRTPLVLAKSKAEWEAWCRRRRSRRLVEFAERWTALMEELLTNERRHVRHMAAQTMAIAGARLLTSAELREVIRILSVVWYRGHSLQVWAIKQRLIENPFDSFGTTTSE